MGLIKTFIIFFLVSFAISGIIRGSWGFWDVAIGFIVGFVAYFIFNSMK